MHNHVDLVDHLIANGTLVTPHIISAFEHVDRKDFVPEEHGPLAYADAPLPLHAGATISQPTTVAFMLELLQPRDKHRILDVGAGSGWTTALLSRISRNITATEIEPKLVDYANLRLPKYAPIRVKPAKTLGAPIDAPFDRILVSAAASDVPQQLLDQLAIGGVMVLPVQDAIWRITKTDDHKTEIEKFPGFAFVPLR